MKHTFIFKRDKVVDEDDLCRLVKVLHTVGVSYYKTSQTDRQYDFVQVFTDQTTMHHIAYKAYFSGEQLRVALPAARRRGDTAISRATNRWDNLRRNAAEEPQRQEFTDTQRIDWLQKSKALVNTPNTSDGLAHIHLDGLHGHHFYDRTYRDVIDRAMLAELEACKRAMHGIRYSTPVQMPGGTKRSKRSA